jgi:hypothetical protein
MKLSIVGCPDKERFRPYIKRAVLFYAESLMSEKMLEQISIKVVFDKSLDVHGYANVLERTENGKARSFEIQVNPFIGSHDILETLAHEMVHVKQFAYSETNDSLTRWKGTFVPDELDYYDQPWEIEAYGMTPGLFTKFAIKEKLWDIFRDVANINEPLEHQPIKWKDYCCENTTI